MENINPNAPNVPQDNRPKSKGPLRHGSVLSLRQRAATPTPQVKPGPGPSSIRYDNIRTKIQAVVELNHRFLDSGDLKNLGIEFHPGVLDFTTGDIPKRHKYYQPLSVDQVKQYLDMVKGLERQEDIYDIYYRKNKLMMRDGSQGEARAFCHMIDTHLGGIINQKVNWSGMMMYNTEFSLHCQEEIGGWEPVLVLPYNIRANNGKIHPCERHSDFPHMIAFVATEAQLSTTSLSAGEVAAFLCLAEDYSKESVFDYKDKWAKFDTFPIVILSGSARNVRIVQALYHRKSQGFTVYSSRILQFHNGITRNMPEYLQLLGWLIARPLT